MLSEICKTEKVRYCMVSLIRGIFELKQKNPTVSKKQNRMLDSRGCENGKWVIRSQDVHF